MLKLQFDSNFSVSNKMVVGRSLLIPVLSADDDDDMTYRFRIPQGTSKKVAIDNNYSGTEMMMMMVMIINMS